VQYQVESDVRFAVDAAFREHGIEIPFPQRDLHVRSGLEAWQGKGS
jgi:small-conductance mechanosensitive channel